MRNETAANPEPDVTEAAKRAGKPRAARKAGAARRTVASPRPEDEADEAKTSRKLVVFFRHGIAEDPSGEKPDGERSLTTSGHDRTKRSARGLQAVVSKIDVICSSPLLRALQTALWVTKAYGGKVKVQTTNALLPDAEPADTVRIIREVGARTIVLVGHEPNLTRCIAELLGAPGLVVNLRRAGCAAVTVDHEGRGTLEWVLAPRVLRGL